MDLLTELPTAKTRRMVVLGLMALAAALFAIAVIVYVGNPRSTDLPVAIQSVLPEPGTDVLNQVDVVVDLAVGYTATMDINGIEIPEEQLIRAEALNQLTFKPGVGQVLDRLQRTNCVRVQYWLTVNSPADSQEYTWCFDAT